MEENSSKKTFMKSIVKAIANNKIFCVTLILIFLSRILLFSVNEVNGMSMEPTLSTNDTVLIDKQVYKVTKLNRFDVVVFDHDINSKDILLIKRVIGLPGEDVRYSNGELFINNKKVICDSNLTAINMQTRDFDSGVIPAGSYFVMGDNRKVSLDSRIIGPINEKTLLGRVIARIRPFNKFKAL